jgi:hypothetical protein
MTSRKKGTPGPQRTKKLKLAKETLKNLDPKRKASEIRGGEKASVGNDWGCGGGGTRRSCGNDWGCGGGGGGGGASVGNCW